MDIHEFLNYKAHGFIFWVPEVTDQRYRQYRIFYVQRQLHTHTHTHTDQCLTKRKKIHPADIYELSSVRNNFNLQFIFLSRFVLLISAIYGWKVKKKKKPLQMI